MPFFEDHLRDALGPRYTLGRELGSGGMGVVYLAHDNNPGLDLDVAIKALRPEIATIKATERFLRESAILARLTHPHIVRVYDAAVAGDIPYYVMERLVGETLADRLSRGPLAAAEARQLGLDLLTALAAAHRQGVIHRDVKPSNLFIRDGRGVLTDFGVAKSLGKDTGKGPAPGTAAYMAPEQMKRQEVGPLSDQYQAAMVIYEAYAGERWISGLPPEAGDWPETVPRETARALRKALMESPADRWSSVERFRQELERGEARRRGPLVTAGVLALGLAAVLFLARFRSGGPFSVALESVEQHGGGGGLRVADSISGALAATLAGFPDFSVVPPSRRASLRVSIDLDVLRDSVRAAVTAATRRGSHALPSIHAAVLDWPAVAETLADRIVTELWSAESPVGDLSGSTLPQTAEGKAAWLRAERLEAQGRWAEALAAYRAAEATDSTCWLCSWRLTDAERWLGLPRDPAQASRTRAHLLAFPARYQSLIRASLVPLPARLDTLDAVTRDHRFFLAWFHLGDESFHRGSLFGRPRRDAEAAFARTVDLRPDYVPGWEHLAWVRIADGDAAGARAALDEFERLSDPRDPFTAVLQALHEAGYAWRFAPQRRAEQVTLQQLERPEVRQFADRVAGARMMPIFEAPRGAVWVGAWFAAQSAPDAQRSGLLAQLFGYLALGRMDSVLTTERKLRQAFPDLRPFLAELNGLIVLEDSAGAGAMIDSARAALAAVSRGADPDARRRAGWMLALLGHGPGDPAFGAPLARLLEAESVARSGNWPDALRRTGVLVADTTAADLAVGYRTVLHLDRLSWSVRSGDLDAARRAVRWNEHSVIEGGYLVGPPQAGEVDWAFRTLGRWRFARLLDERGETDRDVCRAYRDVARLWRDGDAVHAARADSADARADALRCNPLP